VVGVGNAELREHLAARQATGGLLVGEGDGPIEPVRARILELAAHGGLTGVPQVSATERVAAAAQAARALPHQGQVLHRRRARGGRRAPASAWPRHSTATR
jgi:hypothetical protein